MTKDRVRQLSEQAASIYFRRYTEATLPDIIERTILAALDESWGESSDPNMQWTGAKSTGGDVPSATCGLIFHAMSAVRRAALKEGM